MNIENNIGQDNKVDELDKTIINWYDHEKTDAERIKLRESIAQKVLNGYIENQRRTLGAEPVIKPETLSVLLKSLELIEKLREISISDNRTLDPRIEAVMVQSGPGLFLEKKKQVDQYGDNTYRWLNRDRILAGLAYARRIAATKKSAVDGTHMQGHDLTMEDLEKYAPIIFYNGNAEENAELEQVLQNWSESGWENAFAEEHPIVKKFPYPSKFPYPQSKIRIATKPMRHTGEQMINLKEETLVGGKLEGTKNIALAATILDFIRDGNYIQKVLNDSSESEDSELKLWAYPIRLRRVSKNEADTVPKYLLGELERLAHYFQQGHLADQPCEFENVSNSL